jgi:hypothetical protein
MNAFLTVPVRKSDHGFPHCRNPSAQSLHPSFWALVCEAAWILRARTRDDHSSERQAEIFVLPVIAGQKR